MLEVLLAIGLVASLGPIVFKMINRQSATMRNIAIVNEVENIMYAFSNYMDANMPVPGDPNNLPEGSSERQPAITGQQISSMLGNFGLSENLSAIWNYFDRQQLIVIKKSESIEGFLLLSIYESENDIIDTLALQEIASMIGPNAATIDYNMISGMTSEWNFSTSAITDDQIQLGLVVQLSRGVGRSDIYLNRVQSEKAVMYTDLLMGPDDDEDEWKSLENTGVVNVETLKGADDLLDPNNPDNLEGYPFHVTDITKINKLEIPDFRLKPPAVLKGPDSGILTIEASTFMVAPWTKMATTALNEANRLEISTVDAKKSLLRNTTESVMGNMRLGYLSSPPKIITNMFKYQTSVFNSGIDIAAKEIRSKSITWDAKINANTIVVENISYTNSGGSGGVLVDNAGLLNMSDFEIRDYKGYESVKNVSNISDEITDDIDTLRASWNCIRSATESGKIHDIDSCEELVK